MEIERRGRVAAAIRREEIEIEPSRSRRRRFENSLDQDAGLENTLHKSDKIIVPILHRFVR